MNFHAQVGILCFFLSCPNLVIAQKRGTAPPVDSPAGLSQILAYGSHIKDPLVRSQFARLVESLVARQRLDCPTAIQPVQRPSTRAAITGIEDALRAATQDGAKVRILRLAALSHAFSVQQVHDLVSLVKADGARAESILTLYPRITDPQASYTLLSLVGDPVDQTKLIQGIEALKEALKEKRLKSP